MQKCTVRRQIPAVTNKVILHHPHFPFLWFRHSRQVGFTLSQATKALRESRGIALLYFRPRHQKGVRCQRHAPAATYPRERPDTHFTGGWVGLRTGLDRCGKSRLHRDSIPGPSSPQAIVIPTTIPSPTVQTFYGPKLKQGSVVSSGPDTIRTGDLDFIMD